MADDELVASPPLAPAGEYVPSYQTSPQVTPPSYPGYGRPESGLGSPAAPPTSLSPPPDQSPAAQPDGAKSHAKGLIVIGAVVAAVLLLAAGAAISLLVLSRDSGKSTAEVLRTDLCTPKVASGDCNIDSSTKGVITINLGASAGNENELVTAGDHTHLWGAADAKRMLTTSHDDGIQRSADNKVTWTYDGSSDDLEIIVSTK